MSIYELFVTLLFGFIEGVTEWLPISSTGHMILLERFINFKESVDIPDVGRFMEMFRVVIQLGAIMAVVLLFWKRIWPFQTKKNVENEKKPSFIKWDIMQMWFHVLVASVPAAIIGFFLDDWMDEHFYRFEVVAVTLIVYGVAFIVIEERNKRKKAKMTSIQDITYTAALLIGVFQILALIPGTSRSGATIVGALLIGVSRTVAAEFTFYLAIPVMFGASLLKVVKFGLNFTGTEFLILVIAMVTAFLVSIFVIKFLMDYIKKHDFKVFGYYRIVLGIIAIGFAIFL